MEYNNEMFFDWIYIWTFKLLPLFCVQRHLAVCEYQVNSPTRQITDLSVKSPTAIKSTRRIISRGSLMTAWCHCVFAVFLPRRKLRPFDWRASWWGCMSEDWSTADRHTTARRQTVGARRTALSVTGRHRRPSCHVHLMMTPTSYVQHRSTTDALLARQQQQQHETTTARSACNRHRTRSVRLIGSRPSGHYFRSVCLFVCAEFFQPS